MQTIFQPAVRGHKRRRPISNRMRFSWACALVLVLALLAGCGGSDDRGQDRGNGDEARGATMPIGLAAAERFAGIELPSRLSDLQARKEVGPQDDSIALRFTIARDELTGLRSILTEPLEEGFLTVTDRPSLGWKVEDSKRFLGASDMVGGVGRQVLVDLDEPDRPVVYIVAGTAG